MCIKEGEIACIKDRLSRAHRTSWSSQTRVRTSNRYSGFRYTERNKSNSTICQSEKNEYLSEVDPDDSR